MNNKVQIKIKGHIDKSWEDWFDGMEISYEEDNTLLTGEIQDDAFLHGILNKLRDLSLKLISINPTND